MLLLTVSLLMSSVQPEENNDVLDTFLAGSGFGPFFEFSGDRRLRNGEATVFGKCFELLLNWRLWVLHKHNLKT